jgi:glucose/arabinose dehydrogenase
MSRSISRRLLAWVGVWLSASVASAQLPPPVVVNNQFSNPVFATSAPGSPDTLYVVQQGGAIRPLNVQTGAIGATVLNMPAVSNSFFVSGGERGLLGLAFHPEYQTNGLMYVKYTVGGTGSGTPAGGALRVEQYQVNLSTGVADPASRRTVLQWDHDPLSGNTNHNAGWIGFNPRATGAAANNLYIPTGDGGGGNDPNNYAQNTSAFQGKLLRVNVGSGITTTGGYTIPAGNMTGANVLPELYSYGLRNPYRASFDRGTGNLYIGDVGQSNREEVNLIANGATGGQNFGWRVREGTIQNPAYPNAPTPAGAIDPIHDYPRSVGGSITGGNVYRGSLLDTNGSPLDGTYFFGDFVSGRVMSFRANAAGTGVTDVQDRTAAFGFTGGNAISPSSFAEDGFGNLYVLNYNGSVIRLVPVPEPATVGLIGAAGLAAAAGWRRLRRG